MLPESLGYLFDAPLALAPSRPAVLQDDLALSFQVLDERCNRLANALLSLGAKPGARIGLLFGNDFRFVESLLAPMRIGAVTVPLNIRMGDDALAYVVNDAEAEIVVASAGLAHRARTLLDRLPRVRHLIVDGPPLAGSLAYDGLLDNASCELARRRIDPEAICLQPYTSGSTGNPKGVLLAHAGQIWNADLVRKAGAFDQTERGLIAVPLFHKNALVATKALLLAGGSIVILPAFDPAEVIRAIERYHVTYLTGVPAMYKLILAQHDLLRQHRVNTVRYAMCGSAEVPEELLEEFRRGFGAPLVEGYGLTEGGPVPIINLRWGVHRRGSCGRAAPGSEVKVVADDGTTELGPGQVGELIVRNPGIAKGYWRLPEVTARKFRNGWLYTGDLMRYDAEGFYYYVGRRDDMINVAGENMYPKEVEDILMRHTNVRDVCVVPAPHAIKGEVPVAFVVEKVSGATNEEELQAFFLARGAAYAHPRRVYFLDALPLGGTGKVDRSALKQLAMASGPISARGVTPSGEYR